MRLTPTEEDRLRIFVAAELARRTRDRGLPLNAPEAVALACDEMHMAARAGATFDEVVETGRSAVPPSSVLAGVADVVQEIRVEVLLDEGSRLIVLREPFGPATADGPGSVQPAEDELVLAPGRRRRAMAVTNTSRRPVRVSSHFPFWQVNPRLRFDREAARGFRLDLPAGDSLRWAPGETRDVVLVAFGGTTGPEAGT